jgi:CRP-like cAMP-binding protein
MVPNGAKINHVYFPLTGMISLVTELKDGTSLESMTVGCEGFSGLPVFHGVETSRTMAMCQIEGTFLRLPAVSFAALLKKAPQLALVLHRYAQYAYDVVAQSAACNSMHLIEQRCARWLLVSSDAVGSLDFGLTHEFLSQMLAVRRPGVTVAIGDLERRKLVAHRYGRITIIDKKGMEKASCECYRTVKDRERELLA